MAKKLSPFYATRQFLPQPQESFIATYFEPYEASVALYVLLRVL